MPAGLFSTRVFFPFCCALVFFWFSVFRFQLENNISRFVCSHYFYTISLESFKNLFVRMVIGIVFARGNDGILRPHRFQELSTARRSAAMMPNFKNGSR